MRRFLAPLYAARALAAIAAGALLATAVPAPVRGDDIASKKIWMLSFEHGQPDRVTLGREPTLESYWYFPFALKNEDAEDHGFFLEVTAADEKKNEYRSLANPLVKEIARRRMGVKKGEPLWSHDDLTTGHEPTDPSAPFPRKLDLPVIKAGETIRCVAIFKDWSREADKIVIRVRGLTNDVIVQKTAPHERKLSERVLEIEYSRPGDEYYRIEDPLEYVGRRWVSVERTIKTDLE